MVLFDYNLRDYAKYLRDMNLNLKNAELNNLLNGNTIQNLPAINIITTNPDVNTLQSCRDGPIFMGRDGTDFSCRQLCGTNGRLFHVNPGEEIFSNGQRLEPGMYCGLRPPNCNLNTTYAVATGNSVACRSKFPRIFGGPEGNQIIACNNSVYDNPNNILWDNLKNQRVTQFTEMFDANERLSNNNFRFTCRFGDDQMQNRYIEHPIDRFHPQRNYCSRGLFRGHRDILQLPSGECYCGNPDSTRVRNKFPGDEFSECTACFSDFDNANNIATGGNDCFTMFSNFTEAGQRPPCLASRFNREGNFCESIKVHVQEDNVAFPFLPVDITNNQLSDRLNAIEIKRYRGD